MFQPQHHNALPTRRRTPRRATARTALLIAATLSCATLLVASTASAQGRPASSTFSETIQRVIAMPSNAELQRRASSRGLNVLNVLWEDTARSAGSAFGPNISDVTLQVLEETPGGRRSHLLPVLRFPNFSDRTADLPLDSLHVRVGNQREGGELETVPLRAVLSDLGRYLSDPPVVRRRRVRIDLTAPRDTHALVSAQHVFLPIPREGQATFTPVIFNYQSSVGNPGVLTLLVTRQGTSVTVIENRPGEQSHQGWGQQLFYNRAGERAPFTAERLSTVTSRIERGEATAQDAGALDPGADVLLFIQVPLRVRRDPAAGGGLMFAPGAMDDYAVMEEAMPMDSESDVEVAVLGHGEVEGPFIELNGLSVVRDERFPIRVTVQFYRATSNGVVSDADLDEVRAQIERVYEQGDYVGSLVVPDGPRDRPTDWIRTHPEAEADTWRPVPWWNSPRTPQNPAP